jgi:hypothetical protein
MLIVGYKIINDTHINWKLKGSFGTAWGEYGFLQLESERKDGPGKCGIQLIPVVPQQII